jgi:hypothetical protein
MAPGMRGDDEACRMCAAVVLLASTPGCRPWLPAIRRRRIVGEPIDVILVDKDYYDDDDGCCGWGTFTSGGGTDGDDDD